MVTRRISQLGAAAALLVLIAGCGTVKGWFAKKKPDKPPDIMAEEGITQLKKKKYEDAIETFEKLKDRYPYSDQALLAQIKVADAYFYKKKYDEAYQAYREFEKLHPTNKAVPYCIYRQGLCHYRQRSTIDRDQTFTAKALAEFKRLKQKFPESEYVPKAEAYMAKCRQDLAAHEFYVGEFYFRTKRYPSALERFQTLAQEYPEYKSGAVKGYIAKCQAMVANPEKKSGNFITNLFDAQW
jgi:outer membrane protein assembly factor BamD